MSQTESSTRDLNNIKANASTEDKANNRTDRKKTDTEREAADIGGRKQKGEENKRQGK